MVATRTSAVAAVPTNEFTRRILRLLIQARVRLFVCGKQRSRRSGALSRDRRVICGGDGQRPGCEITKRRVRLSVLSGLQRLEEVKVVAKKGSTDRLGLAQLMIAVLWLSRSASRDGGEEREMEHKSRWQLVGLALISASSMLSSACAATTINQILADPSRYRD